MSEDGALPRVPCGICGRPVWDDARALELADLVGAAASPVHRGCARRRARLERELELAARKGRARSSSMPGAGARPALRASCASRSDAPSIDGGPP